MSQNSDYLEGYRDAINDLRKLNDTVQHVRTWSHSRDLKFAPVELSDYLVRIYNMVKK